jgi:hypothetical protein
VRTEAFFPDLPGYVTLRCDFHMHTVFSDGLVWPTVRAEEAWCEGYDAIAITEHLEYPRKTDLVITNHQRAHDLARPTAEALGLLLVPGTELTRGEPPGHWNLLFLTNLNVIPTNDHRAALRAACAQGAFVFWNHPAWKQTNQIAKWYDEQQEALTNGWLHGLEVVNGTDYDPIVHQWCLDRQLTLLGNSDVHGPVGLDYAYPPGSRRPMTLVFARERSLAAIHEALQQRRTAICFSNSLFGEAQFLRPLFERSIEVRTPVLTIAPRGRGVLQVHNRCAVDFVLKARGKVAGIPFPERLTLYAGKTVAVDIRPAATALKSVPEVRLPYEARNLWTAPDETLPVEIVFTLKPEEAKRSP